MTSAVYNLLFIPIQKLIKNIIRFGFCRCKNWCHKSELDARHQRYRVGPKMGPSAHCRVPLCKPTSDLDS